MMKIAGRARSGRIRLTIPQLKFSNVKPLNFESGANFKRNSIPR